MFHVPDIPETIRAFSIQIDKYGYVEWSIKRYYIEIIILTIVGSIFAIERKKELDHKNLMEEISKSVDKITCVNSIIELICEKLNIELGLVISKEGHRLYISHGYSIKKKTSLQSNEFDNPNDMQILNEILKECSTVTINDGIHPKLRSELINAMPGYESIIQESNLITFLCISISSKDPYYYFFLFNKLTKNRGFIRKFTDRDQQVAKTVGPLLYNCIKDLK